MPATNVAAEITSTVLQDDTSLGQIAAAFHLRHVVKHELAYTRILAWPTEAPDLTDLTAQARYEQEGHGTHEMWAAAAGDEWSMHVRLGHGHINLAVSAHTEESLADLIADVRAACPVAESGGDAPRVPVTFWSYSPNGPTARSRMLAVPTWEDVASNYPADLADQIAHLMGDRFHPGTSGQLMLWHGPPGTGKTWALRALASEWRTWCDVHYITDPDVFFGDKASYMLDVLLYDGDPPISSDDDPPEPEPRAKDGRWRLLIMEDTGELLAADAKAREGQALSRLLNVVDGLIGQGLRVMILITTNEVLRDLHPAVQRPGRCAAQLGFEPFGVDEARGWLATYGYDTDDPALPHKELTIAELYERLAGEDAGLRPPEPAGVGFTSR